MKHRVVRGEGEMMKLKDHKKENKRNVVESGECDKCNVSFETVHHLLLGCPNSSFCDEVLNACERLNVSPQLELILKNSEIINVITDSLVIRNYDVHIISDKY